jgi:hypothetical protein
MGDRRRCWPDSAGRMADGSAWQGPSPRRGRRHAFGAGRPAVCLRLEKWRGDPHPCQLGDQLLELPVLVATPPQGLDDLLRGE